MNTSLIVLLSRGLDNNSRTGAGAADAVNLVLADHLGERQAELGGAHGAGDRDKSHGGALGGVTSGNSVSSLLP